jgi:beta-lactamase superfamily II metal-dependent hydrolase
VRNSISRGGKVTEDTFAASDLTLTILDVGHGNSAVLNEHGTVIVIDTGPKSSLLEYLREQGIKKIDTVLVSHADQDHIGGLVGLIASGLFQVDCIRLNTDSLKGSAIWNDLLYELSRLSSAGELDFKPSLTASDTGEFDRGAVQIEVLGPSTYLAGKGPGSTDRHGRRLRTNSVSAVIRISENGEPIALLPGDLDEIGLDDLIDHGAEMSASILVFPHHGGKTGSAEIAEEFSRRMCEMVSPSTVVFSIGRSKRFLHPKPEIVYTVRESLGDVRIMCTQLSEHCAGFLPMESPEHLNVVFSQGREARRCCAGTIIVDLSSPYTILPSEVAHQNFISIAAPESLCR